MDKEKLDELERLALAATFGVRNARQTNMGWHVGTEQDGFLVAVYYRHDKAFTIAEREAEANAMFTVAADPQTVLELIRAARGNADTTAECVGCAFDGGLPLPGCPVHDPTAPPTGES